jgi:hypothetical protein
MRRNVLAVSGALGAAAVILVVALLLDEDDVTTCVQRNCSQEPGFVLGCVSGPL